MKTNGRIRELLAIPCFNDSEYCLKVVWPLLQYLGFPAEACRAQFPIENPFGSGQLRLDFLVHRGDVPLVTIEGEPTARQFDEGFKQAKNYSRNFKPRQRGCPMQERTVPFLLTAAGHRAQMCRAVVRGLNIEYEPILRDSIPAFLEWHELLAEAGQLQPTAALQPQQQVLVADAANQFFRDLYSAIDRAQAEGDARAQDFLTRRLVGIDDDPFCVSCARELLTFLYPQHADRLQVFLHNCLYQRAPTESEIDEDPGAEPHLRAGRYDLVIGNPPGNDEYSGTNREEIACQWERRFGHAEGGLMDHHCFIRRAVELARPDSGRVCLLVPEGLLARDNRGLPALRLAVAQECELRLVITLPRVFKNNNARMAMLYLVRTPHPNRNRKVVLAEVREKWRDADGVERATDLYGELESIVDTHLETRGPAS